MINRVLEGQGKEPCPTLPLDVVNNIAWGGFLQVKQGQTAIFIGQFCPFFSSPIGQFKGHLIFVGLGVG